MVNKIKKVYVADQGNAHNIRSMFKNRGYEIALQPSDNFDALVLTGGTDICPYLYGEKAITTTQSWDIERDLREVQLVKSLDPYLPKIGICRGAQLLNVIYGGKLIQHANNHAGPNHEVYFAGFKKDDPERVIEINSTHHQLMVPPDQPSTILAYAKKSTERKSQFLSTTINRQAEDDNDQSTWDVEIAHLWYGNSLCFQAHPEYSHKPTTDLFWECVEWLGSTVNSSEKT